ncbi:MAG: hypothetical protein KGH57_04465 [Candidatus Micrarchaeota archaeon]|nr:hypothetical protein [Candidatus Micrarchaeota archaeon]
MVQRKKKFSIDGKKYEFEDALIIEMNKIMLELSSINANLAKTEKVIEDIRTILQYYGIKVRE